MEKYIQLLPANIREFAKYFPYSIIIMLVIAVVYLSVDLQRVNNLMVSTTTNDVGVVSKVCAEQVDILKSEVAYLRSENTQYNHDIKLASEALRNLISSKENLRKLSQITQ